ncbi:bifunctional diguanylate cyclase/phosphodiesterase [Blastococcus sp. CT_GayMR19]|uniref:putative bifunctional diguanylate cyclase/phosphodiesterase n=1 Tax=Blastococcus sp. CT_GayMR19 TaxID=2559608 RepID=UPI0010742D43|nr:bifunctional diguanylate cyclase/phosphodiesterase [Blastococcus sp. CT_GayMR19]TFV79466.1 bifunctional diguanylate cyclase/phosphodiesterase [Blastococcus sp. CT_GayMR19]
MDVDRTPPRPALLRRVRPTLLVVALTLALLTLAALAGIPFMAEPAPAAFLDLPWWVLAAGFAATEACVFHLQIRREARTVSISELPLVLGLFLASPVQLLIGRLAGSAAIFVLHRRSSLLKTVFNLAMIALQTSVAVAVFHLVGGGREVTSSLVWLGGYAGPIAANCVASIALALVIAVYEGDLRIRPILRNMVSGDPAAPLVITVGLVAVLSLTVAPHSAVLLLLTGAALLLGYRGYAALADRHLNTERLYRFAQAVTSAPEVDETLRNVLREARELLHAERAEVAFVASDGGDVAHVRLGATGRLGRSSEAPAPADQWLLSRVVGDGEPLLITRGTRDADERRWLDAQVAREAVAVPLRGGTGILGVLVVTDRLGDVRTYAEDDVRLLETVAHHTSVALQNGKLMDQLRHDALHDALTGLPNRAALQRQMAAALEEVADGRSPGAAVMILDLDRFKEVNDTLGHQHGDLLLVEVGTRLRTAVGPAGFVARLGGDEFAILLSGIDDEDRAVRVGRRLLRSLEQPVPLDGLEVEVGGSLGLAMAPAHATDPAGLLKRADMAMYDAKASTGGLRLYEPDADSDNPRRLMLVSELRTALSHGRIEVHVQPQGRLATGETVGVEALVRWNHAELGFIPPDEFIPVAERSGLIGLVTTRVLDLSLAAVADWRRQGVDLGVAVNLSTRSLLDADLVDEVSRLLRRHGVPASRLTLEVTEGSVMADPARAIALLHQLRALGVRLSVDDFGTGYSSLSYLKSLPVDEVKIDRSFVTNLSGQNEDVAIVRAIVDLGRHLGLEVVAEGIEDQPTWDLLSSMGCDLGQGWHHGRPMPTAEFVPWLRAHAGSAGQRPALRVL